MMPSLAVMPASPQAEAPEAAPESRRVRLADAAGQPIAEHERESWHAEMKSC